eukprot:TRINITY_DN13438_c0_g1_i1.p1 TRINITY_DN13438_c0_g1~~TRINITY_DN13438_c0_g1_i1.p1  ORF type:complete len:515 (+),score=100.39 TRINITY_DN13438_c0_g1_i1:126-1547(+)
MALPNALNRAKESATYFMNILKAPIRPLYKKTSSLLESSPAPAPVATAPSTSSNPASSAFNLLSGSFLGSKMPDKIVFAKKVTTLGDFEAKLAMPFCADLRDFIHGFVDEFNQIGQDVDESVDSMSRDPTKQPLPPTLALGTLVESEDDILRDRIQLERGAAFKAWMSTASLHFAAHKAWEGDFSGPDDPKLSQFLEQYVVDRIYSHLFFPNKRRDFNFAQGVQSISHLTAESLDIKHPVTEDLIDYCGSMLTKMNFEKTPSTKLHCVAQCCLEIFAYLKKAQGTLATADDFLPLLIYVIVKSNPIYLISNVKYLTACLPSHMMLSDSGFFLTYIEVATQHISRVDPKQIVDIARSVESDWLELSEKDSTPAVDAATTKTPTETPTTADGPATTASRSSITSLGDFTPEVVSAYPFLPKTTEEVLEQNLVPKLLEEYKRLALADWNRKQLQLASDSRKKTPHVTRAEQPQAKD